MPRLLGSALGSCLALMACAGDLDRPERFDAVLAALDGSAAGAPATPPPSDAGSQPTGMDAAPALVDAGGPPACVVDVFAASCGAPGCHARGSPQIDLVSPGVTERLLDQSSTSTICEGRTYVASDGGASLLLDKLMTTPPCGSRMPLIGALTSEQQTCLEQWVQSQMGGGP